MTAEDPLLERARARAKAQREFYRHLIIYVLVCTFLVILDLSNDDPGNPERFLGLNWAFWPVIGWGAAVAIHGFKTFVGTASADRWEERKVQQLYEKEKQRDR